MAAHLTTRPLQIKEEEQRDEAAELDGVPDEEVRAGDARTPLSMSDVPHENERKPEEDHQREVALRVGEDPHALVDDQEQQDHDGRLGGDVDREDERRAARSFGRERRSRRRDGRLLGIARGCPPVQERSARTPRRRPRRRSAGARCRPRNAATSRLACPLDGLQDREVPDQLRPGLQEEADSQEEEPHADVPQQDRPDQLVVLVGVVADEKRDCA